MSTSISMSQTIFILTVTNLYFELSAAEFTELPNERSSITAWKSATGFSISSNKSCLLTTADAEGTRYKTEAPLLGIDVMIPLPMVCNNTPMHTRLFLNGTVRLTSLNNSCGEPVRALLDIWQADGDGHYSDISAYSPDYVRAVDRIHISKKY